MTKFVLLGFTDNPKLQIAICSVFNDISHNPGRESWHDGVNADATPGCTFSSVTHPLWTPVVLQLLLQDVGELLSGEKKAISFSGYIIQYVFLCSCATSECFLFVAMLYNCYAALNNPLLYIMIMSSRLHQAGNHVMYHGCLHAMLHMSGIF